MPQFMFEQKYEKISEFLSENFHFLVVKFSMYLNRRVFVMNIVDPDQTPQNKFSPTFTMADFIEDIHVKLEKRVCKTLCPQTICLPLQNVEPEKSYNFYI